MCVGVCRCTWDIHRVDQKVPDTAFERQAGSLQATCHVSRDSAHKQPLDNDWLIVG